MKAQKDFIHRIDTDFDLVMITERMEESLVLLADILCVPLETVIIVKDQNVRPKVMAKNCPKQTETNLSNTWNQTDYFMIILQGSWTKRLSKYCY